MSKQLLILLLLFSVLMFTGTCLAQEAVIDPQLLLDGAESTHFLRVPFSNDFAEPQGIVNELKGQHHLNQYYIEDGYAWQTVFSILPAVVEYSYANRYVIYNKLHLSDFHVSLRMAADETITPGDGYCWLEYNDADVVGASRSMGVKVMVGDNAYAYRNTSEGKQTKAVYDLTAYQQPGVWYKVDIIRLSGIAYFYIDDVFVFAYEDKIDNLVSWQAGTSLVEGAVRSTCMFDDFRVWQK